MARLSGGFQKLHTKLSGWRRLAILNIGAMVLLTLLLCGFTVASILKTDLSEIANEGYNYDEASRGDAVRNTFLFHSSLCTEPTARNVNTVLHLIVNAVSSAVLASSNFFSQVLSSPSRAEVDVSHARGRSLDVGVLSWRNALGLSPFKTVAWVALLVTSLPLHLLFNSAILQSADSDGSHAQDGLDGSKDYQTLPYDLYVVWGLSPTYLAGLLALAIAAIQIPWLLGLLRMPGHMPPVGSDSRAIAAACHVSPLSKAPLDEQKGGEGEGYEPVSMADEEGHGGLLAVSRSLLSWGVVKMPQAWYDAHVDRRNAPESRRAVEHLSFGTSLDGVKKPIRGRIYS
ncbi:unnamed protein product [Alternaria alternata]